ncbi:hypothetical protein C0Q70_00300 [Pomacea canaliculata]|uniref:Uncharacterized protein n=1 Tax=Pomacea canaliculata TaxID=400727 RepID=A0A2T7PWD6_POMCA|nr:hypothetical protein C0Q70_00300 [Pomacea canaliculata]
MVLTSTSVLAVVNIHELLSEGVICGCARSTGQIFILNHDESKFKVSTEPARVDPSRLLLVLMAGVRTLVLCGGSSETKSGSEIKEAPSACTGSQQLLAFVLTARSVKSVDASV